MPLNHTDWLIGILTMHIIIFISLCNWAVQSPIYIYMHTPANNRGETAHCSSGAVSDAWSKLHTCSGSSITVLSSAKSHKALLRRKTDQNQTSVRKVEKPAETKTTSGEQWTSPPSITLDFGLVSNWSSKSLACLKILSKRTSGFLLKCYKMIIFEWKCPFWGHFHSVKNKKHTAVSLMLKNDDRKRTPSSSNG